MDYLITKSNRRPYAEAVKAMERENSKPVLIWGGTGIGKTALLRQAEREGKTRWPDKNVDYIKTGDWTRLLCSSICARDEENFREYFREEVDILLLDELETVYSREATCMELISMVQYRAEQGKITILASAKRPDLFAARYRKTFGEDSLKLCRMLRPDREMREMALDLLCREMSIALSDREREELLERPVKGLGTLRGLLARQKASIEFT